MSKRIRLTEEWAKNYWAAHWGLPKKRISKVYFTIGEWCFWGAGELHLGPFIKWEAWCWSIGFDLVAWSLEICFDLVPRKL